jgi:hypothetical protein
VRALWKGAETHPATVAKLYQQGIVAAAKGELPAKDEDPAQRGRFLHGLTFVPGEAGFGSQAFQAAFEEARALAPGPDALALSLFAAGEPPAAPLVTARPLGVFGSQSDAALASAAAAAHAAGVRVLLSLEVLASWSGAWADVLSWTGADDATLFQGRYARIALHYALLAELLGCETFSFGSNLDDEHAPGLFGPARADWRSLIANLRGGYRGSLAFTARTPAAAEETGFLEELDLIGLFLYPRGLGAAPGEDELVRVLRFELQQAVDLGVRWNKPVMLLQVGFPARADSWAQPQVPRGALDLGAQQRYFTALADVLGQGFENAGTLPGLFLWNWPVAFEGEPGASFALRGRPVEGALRRIFAR